MGAPGGVETGWGRILAEAEPIGGHGEGAGAVTYHAVSCRRIVHPLEAPGQDCRLGLNPYLNCEHACAHCYARTFSDRRQGPGAAAGDEFGRRIHAKREAAAALRRDLARLDRAPGPDGPGPIAIGTATDPYQPLERTRRLTRGLLEVLARRPGSVISIATRSDLVLRDLDLLREIHRQGHARVTVGLPTLDAELAASLEPGAPPPAARLATIAALARAGVPVGVAASPLLPELTDGPPDLRRVVCAAREARAGWLSAQVLSLPPGAREAFFAWLEGARPDLVRRYRRLYPRTHPPAAVQDRIERLVSAIRRQYGLPLAPPFPRLERVPASPAPPPPGAAGEQLLLFGRPGEQLPLFEPPPREPRLLPTLASAREAIPGSAA